MKRKAKTTIKTVAGICISIAFILLIVKDVDALNVLSIIYTANPLYVIAAFIIYLSSFVVRTLRWNTILTKVESNFSELLSIVIIGWGTNNILPARMGELVRAYLFKIEKKVSFVYSLSTIFMEKLFDIIILVLFAGVLFLIFPMPVWVTNISIFASAIFISIIVVLFLVNFRESFFISKFDSLPYKRLSSYIKSGIRGTHILRHKKNQGISWVYTFLIWLIELGVFYFAALSLNMNVPFFVMVLALVIVNFGIIIPSAPAYIGTFEAFFVLTLTGFGFGAPAALAYAVLVHGVHFLTSTPIALVLIAKKSIPIRELYSAGRL